MKSGQIMYPLLRHDPSLCATYILLSNILDHRMVKRRSDPIEEAVVPRIDILHSTPRPYVPLQAHSDSKGDANDRIHWLIDSETEFTKIWWFQMPPLPTLLHVVLQYT